MGIRISNVEFGSVAKWLHWRVALIVQLVHFVSNNDVMRRMTTSVR